MATTTLDVTVLGEYVVIGLSRSDGTPIIRSDTHVVFNFGNGRPEIATIYAAVGDEMVPGTYTATAVFVDPQGQQQRLSQTYTVVHPLPRFRLQVLLVRGDAVVATSYINRPLHSTNAPAIGTVNAQAGDTLRLTMQEISTGEVYLTYTGSTFQSLDSSQISWADAGGIT